MNLLFYQDHTMIQSICDPEKWSIHLTLTTETLYLLKIYKMEGDTYVFNHEYRSYLMHYGLNFVH